MAAADHSESQRSWAAPERARRRCSGASRGRHRGGGVDKQRQPPRWRPKVAANQEVQVVRVVWARSASPKPGCVRAWTSRACGVGAQRLAQAGLWAVWVSVTALAEAESGTASRLHLADANRPWCQPRWRGPSAGLAFHTGRGARALLSCSTVSGPCPKSAAKDVSLPVNFAVGAFELCWMLEEDPVPTIASALMRITVP